MSLTAVVRARWQRLLSPWREHRDFNFGEAVKAAVDRLVASGSIDKAIEEQLSKTIGSILASQLREYSDFGKELDEAVKRSLKLHGELDLPSYNDQIIRIVRALVENKTHAVIQQQAAKQLEELLVTPPAEIKLSKLIEQYVESVKEHASGNCVCHGETRVSAHIETDTRYSSSRSEFKEIYLDDEADVEKSKCGIRIRCHNGEVYSLRLERREVDKELFPEKFYGFERMLFQMKAAKSKIVFDCDVDECDLSYESHD